MLVIRNRSIWMRSCRDHNIHTWWNFTSNQTKCLSNHSLDSNAPNCFPNACSYGKPESCAAEIIGGSVNDDPSEIATRFAGKYAGKLNS